MKKSNHFQAKICEKIPRRQQTAHLQKVRVIPRPNVKPIKLEGMDLRPLSQLMNKHDPQWAPCA